jgi:hypothetical protein
MEKTSIHIGQADGISPEGDASGQGTVFTLTPWGREKVLYSFTGEMDGGNPISGLVFDAEGNLYGTTVEGGLFSFYGVVFELIPSGAEYVLYSFTGGTDGGEPYAGVIFDAQAALTAMAPPLRWRRQERSPSSTASAERVIARTDNIQSPDSYSTPQGTSMGRHRWVVALWAMEQCSS